MSEGHDQAPDHQPPVIEGSEITVAPFSPTGQRRRRRRMGDMGAEAQSSQIWLICFTDVMALMLTFFVLLFSMSEPERQTWSQITAALQGEFNLHYGALFNQGPEEELNLDRINFNRALDLSYLSALLNSLIKQYESLQASMIIQRRDSIVISLPQDLLFEPGSADIRQEGARALYALGGSLSRIKNSINVVGHADPRPFIGVDGRYQSNWELSLARAANVAGVLERVGYTQEIGVRGLSSALYDELSDIRDEATRMDLARRVDIIVMDHDGQQARMFSTD